MRFSTLSTAATTLLLASTAMAMPAWPQSGQLTPRSTHLSNLSKLAQQMPKNTLPGPGALALKFVGLGLGTQNYTCLTGNNTAEPGTTGAVAKLYDLGTALNNDPLASWKLSSISALALGMKSTSPQILSLYLSSQGYQQLLGDHYFTLLTPTFSLNQVKSTPFPLALVSKLAEQDAPQGACPGLKGEGAIKWLKLADTTGLSRGGVNTVYRLETAGGNKPATCKGMGSTFEVPYAAQYWVYGPA